MRYALLALLRNLVAGARLAVFRPVDRLQFRVDPLQLLLLVLFSALLDSAADWLRYGPDAELSFAAVGSELAATALLVLTAALLAWWSRQREVLLALPVIVLAAFVSLQFVNAAVDVVPEAAIPGGELGYTLAHLALTAWVVLVLLRSAWVAQGSAPARVGRATVAGLLLSLPLVLPSGILPADPWWVIEGDAVGEPNAASEPMLALQRQLQDDALAELEDHASGGTDLYFIGFAPDGAGSTWRSRMDAARRVMEGHWGASKRTLTYVNDPRAIAEAPIATVTHLREALAEVAAASDPDEDVVMLYLGGRTNTDGSMSVSLPPLELVQLSAAGLRSLLDEQDFRWRIVVLSVCAPGPFIEALADDHTVVIANAAADAEVGECARRGEPVAFGDAFFNEAMPRTSSLPAAFEVAKSRLADPGFAGGRRNVPFLHIGAAIAGKLETVKGRSGTGVTARIRSQARRPA
jgi:hypothetical protein